MSALMEWQQFKDFGMTKDFPLVIKKTDDAIDELEEELAVVKAQRNHAIKVFIDHVHSENRLKS